MNGLAGIAVLLISFLVELRIPMPLSAAKIIGIIVVYLGMALVVWATFHIRGAIRGMVKPRLSELVITGPYRFIRHPVYVGTTVALVGVTLSLRSWIGFLAVLILFLPSEIHRAKLEDKALAKEFGTKWDEYHKRTGFFYPI